MGEIQATLDTEATQFIKSADFLHLSTSNAFPMFSHVFVYSYDPWRRLNSKVPSVLLILLYGTQPFDRQLSLWGAVTASTYSYRSEPL